VRRREAEILAQALAALPRERLTPCLNLGSSSRRVREATQPHLQNLLLASLERRGVRIHHVDRRAEEGVDLVGDLGDAAFWEHLRGLGARLVLCTNLLEHVRDPETLARRCVALLPPGGLICVSVPRSYPYHADPIDNGLRPSVAELAALFPRTRLLAGGIIEDGTLRDSLRRKRIPLAVHLGRLALRLALPFYRPRGWLHHLHRLCWLFRPFAVSWALLEKLPDAGRRARTRRLGRMKIL